MSAQRAADASLRAREPVRPRRSWRQRSRAGARTRDSVSRLVRRVCAHDVRDLRRPARGGRSAPCLAGFLPGDRAPRYVPRGTDGTHDACDLKHLDRFMSRIGLDPQQFPLTPRCTISRLDFTGIRTARASNHGDPAGAFGLGGRSRSARSDSCQHPGTRLHGLISPQLRRSEDPVATGSSRTDSTARFQAWRELPIDP